MTAGSETEMAEPPQPPEAPDQHGRGGRARADTVLSIGTSIASQGALLVTGIVSARALGVEDRGHLAFILLVSQIVAVFGTLGLPIAVTYFIAPDETMPRRTAWRLRKFFPFQIVTVTAVHAVLLVALFASSRDAIKVAAAISLITSGSQVAQTYGLGVLQGLRQFRWFNVLRLLAPATYAVLAALAWVLGGRNLVDMTIAYTAAYVFAGAATVIVASRFFLPVDRRTVDGDPSIGDLSRFGLKGLLGSASPLETFRLDQSIVGLFLAPAELGLYVSAVAFTNLPRFIAQAIGMVAYPHIARHTDQHVRWTTMWRFVGLATLACAAIVGLLELTVARLVPLMFGASFDGAIPVARVLLIASFFLSVRRILSDGARGIGKPGVGTIAELVSWVLLPSLLVCVHFGLVAVAWGLTGCSVVSVCILLVLLQRDKPVPAAANVTLAPVKS